MVKKSRFCEVCRDGFFLAGNASKYCSRCKPIAKIARQTVRRELATTGKLPDKVSVYPRKGYIVFHLDVVKLDQGELFALKNP